MTLNSGLNGEGEALYVCRGRKFQAEGTASAKTLGQKCDMMQLPTLLKRVSTRWSISGRQLG